MRSIMPCIDREIDDYRIFIPAVMPLAAPSAGWWPPVTATALAGHYRFACSDPDNFVGAS